MSNIVRIAAAIESSLPLSARQVRDASDDLISHELIRPGQRGHGAEPRDAREGALILLSSLGATSPRGAGRLAKRLADLRWVHGTCIDPADLSMRAETADAVGFLKAEIGKREFLETQTDLLRNHRQLQVALASLQAAANSVQDLIFHEPWHSALTVELHIGERVIAEVRARLERVPSPTDLSFDVCPPVLFELMAVFSDDAPITDPHLGSETRRFDHKAIFALGAALAS